MPLRGTYLEPSGSKFKFNSHIFFPLQSRQRPGSATKPLSAGAGVGRQLYPLNPAWQVEHDIDTGHASPPQSPGEHLPHRLIGFHR